MTLFILVASGLAADVPDALRRAHAAIDDGRATATLDALVG